MLIYQELSDNQKRFARRLFMLFLSALTLFVGIYTFYYWALGVGAWHSVRDTDKFQISVSGEGFVFAVPDIATLFLGVRSQAASLKAVQADNTKKYNAIVEFLKAKGVEKKDIRTVSYYVNPQYQYDNRPCPLLSTIPCPPPAPPRIVGYEITSTLQVKVRNLDSVGDILDGAVSAGANEVNGPSFTIDDENKLKEEAKKIAIEKAKESAKKLAKELGVRLLRVSGFSESGGVPPIYYARALEAFGKSGDVAATPSIEPGQNEIKVTVTVTVTYEVR